MENKTEKGRIEGYEFGEFFLNVTDEKDIKLFSGNYHITSINDTDLKILKLLFEEHPKSVTKERLCREFFPTSSHCADNLRHSISRLRTAFKGKNEKEIIKTELSVGYRIGVDFKEVREDKLNITPEENGILPSPPLPDDIIVSLPPIAISPEITFAEGGQNNQPALPDDSIKQPPFDKPDEDDKDKAAAGSPPPSSHGFKKEEIKDEMSAFRNWVDNSGKWISGTLLLCVVLSLLISSGFIIYHYFFPPKENINFKVGQLIACAFHLILLGIAFVYYRRHSGPEDFEDDIERYQAVANVADSAVDLEKSANSKNSNRLSNSIVNSTGYKNISDWITAREKALHALGQYRRNWQLLLGAWFSLYLVLFASLFTKLLEPYLNISTEQAKQNLNTIKLITDTLVIMLNNFNTLFILLCFHTLDKPIATENRTPDADSVIISRNRDDGDLLVFGLFVIFGWFIIETILVTVYADSDTSIGIQKFLKGMSGVLGGLAMALYIGRFQSKFLKSPDWLIVILYFYTVIQPLFLYFGDGSIEAEIATTIVMQFALLLKYLLILYMFWLFQSGRLLFYLVRVRRAYEQIDGEWQVFLKVLKK